MCLCLMKIKTFLPSAFALLFARQSSAFGSLSSSMSPPWIFYTDNGIKDEDDDGRDASSPSKGGSPAAGG